MAKAKFGSLLLLIQGILLILFVVFVDYGDDFLPLETGRNLVRNRSINSKLPVFQDVHVAVFLGFALIMTFLRRYTRGMLVHSFLIGGLIIQWATLLQGFFSMNNAKVDLSFQRMFKADYVVMCVLISFGAVVGKCNSLQMLVIAMFQTFFFAINEALSFQILKIADIGRSVVVHVFGAYFGLGVSRMIFSRKVCMSQAISMSNESEMYSVIGTFLLWTYWPTMNSAFVENSASNRAIANTYYALAASCISTFSFTVLQSKEGKFNMIHLQNATIAGGVAVGAIAAMMLHPWGAVIIGIVGALSSVMSYKYLVPTLRRKLKIHDTRGIHAIHGIPGIVSGVASIIAALLANEDKYGTSLYEIYPARTPMVNTTKFDELSQIGKFSPGDDRKAYMQAIYQFGGLVTTVVVAISGGLLTGLVIRVKFFEPVKVNDAFDDHVDFEEANCIDVSSEPEYDDDDEHHHDSVHGKTRLLDSDRHSDIVASDDHTNVYIKSYNEKGSMPDSVHLSNRSIERKSLDGDHQNVINGEEQVLANLPSDDITALHGDEGLGRTDDIVENGIEMKDTSKLLNKGEEERA